MIERHYDDESLIAFLEPQGAVDEHVQSCTECNEKLDTLRIVNEALAEHATWDPKILRQEPVPETIATLRAFAERMGAEDAQAETYLQDLLAGPREGWMAKLLQHPEYRTAGVVRKLIAACIRAISTMPHDAVEIAHLATDIADHLDPAVHTSDTVAKLRGAAWRDRAYALYYTGQFADAERAVCVSESHFSDCVIGDYDGARVGIVRALVERAMERFDSAASTTRSVRDRMRTFADLNRARAADSIAASVLFSCQRYREASHIWSSLASQRSDSDVDEYLGDLMNLASCQREIGDYESALSNYYIVATLLADTANVTDVARTRYNIGVTLAAAGRSKEAIERLQAARAEFLHLGMYCEAAVAAIDLSDLLLACNQVPEVVQLCTSASHQFEQSGIGYGSRARAAIAYLKEAAEAGRATPELVKHVRDYIRELPRQPALLFIPLSA